jgi:hypothetical protein
MFDFTDNLGLLLVDNEALQLGNAHCGSGCRAGLVALAGEVSIFFQHLQDAI